MRRTAIPFVALMIAAIAIAACGEPDSTFLTPDANTGASPSGQILFVADNSIHVWNGRINRLTSGEDARSPSWAPAGDRFVYVRMFEGYSELIVANRNGEPLLQVTNNNPGYEPHTEEYALYAAWAFDPVWSPLGEQLIFASDKGGLDLFSSPLYLWYSEDWEIQPYALPASEALGLLQESPSLSPDGAVAAFVTRETVSDTVRTTEIWTIDLDTGDAEQLIVHPDGAYSPAWSPDGHDIAYVQRDGTSNDIWIRPVDGGAPYRLTDVGTCASPVWSPDGNMIAFFQLRDAEFEAVYIELSRDADGHITATEPSRLFSADGIDAQSGMSWIAD
ncbi:MAG TPA: DPP IV N-terminal domain-containing protein [Thermomicrobiales bacterium]|nr:DPP IV N-terminal domain-containing protein [Thermomicrobiales bacterium]